MCVFSLLRESLHWIGDSLQLRYTDIAALRFSDATCAVSLVKLQINVIV